MSMYRVFSCIVGRGCVLWPVHSFGKTVNLCPAYFYTSGQTCLLLQAFPDFLLLHSSPLQWNGHLFWVLIVEGLISLIDQLNFSFFSITGQGIDLDYRNTEWFALKTNRDHSVISESASKFCILDSFVDYDGYSISSKGFLPTVVDMMVSELNSPIPVHFSLLIPKMLMFSLAISCLTASNLPWFMDLTFQVPMQYCSLQHRTLLPSPVTSTTGYCFCFGSIPSFFLELFLHWSPVAYWSPTDLGVPLSVSYHFAFSYCSWGSQGKNSEMVCHSLLQWTTFC